MLPHVTSGLPGLGGVLRLVPEDFVVVEIPSYEPSGEGEHLYLEVTKTDLTTPAMVGTLAQALEVPLEEIGYGGLKDRRAVTTQRVSVPASAEVTRLKDLPFQCRVLGRHSNKLRRGHLAGNRFRVRVRQAHPEWRTRARAILEALRQSGLANFYGPQRFGVERRNARIGENGVRSGKLFGPMWRRWLMVSAFQSDLFNRYLTARLADGLFDRVLEGDVCGRLPRGGVFLAEDPAAEQPRVDRFEISPMGPLFGHKLMPTKGPAALREQALLDEVNLKLEDFRKVKAAGTRRRIRLNPSDLEIEEAEGDPVFCFELPSGSYATVLLREFMKCEPGQEEAEEADEAD
ncbi:MAG: tRNA pseudouridine(13) synthase TruD [Burkholderiales bacterium]|nr:tRNA pseudouridine(13) synthase TruD [Burkholderiales bacterium]